MPVANAPSARPNPVALSSSAQIPPYEVTAGQRSRGSAVLSSTGGKENRLEKGRAQEREQQRGAEPGPGVGAGPGAAAVRGAAAAGGGSCAAGGAEAVGDSASPAGKCCSPFHRYVYCFLFFSPRKSERRSSRKWKPSNGLG